MKNSGILLYKFHVFLRFKNVRPLCAVCCPVTPVPTTQLRCVTEPMSYQPEAFQPDSRFQVNFINSAIRPHRHCFSILSSSCSKVEFSIPSAMVLSRQCMTSSSSSRDMVMVPGVSVMEFARITLPSFERSLVL